VRGSRDAVALFFYITRKRRFLMTTVKARKKKVKHMINLKAKLHIGRKNVEVIVTLPGRILRRRLEHNIKVR
jgi:hypothetical protein